MMRCALVDLSTNHVVNLIIASPDTDPAPDGHVIVGLPDESAVAIGWLYDPFTGLFTDPNAPT